ncbi:MAG: DNA-directed RNA polymerase subunit alpha [Parcubacteria group bacterium]|nr:DNA-directed RNA polymerase subunit alpha [Parcubacteria group bacterium]
MPILIGELKTVERQGNRSVFEISPLYTGYGATIGNSLRRILLSSMEGAAAVKIKIEGVAHEFTTVPGVLEDVVDIILNLKKVRFKLSGLDSAKAVLTVKGEKEVKAGDLKLPTGAEVINPEQIICTISDKRAEVNMEIEIEKGIGYVPVEQKQKEKLSVGEIAIDAIFSPVKKVSFQVENIRVGDRTDYNKLFIDVETDGSTAPEEVLKRAVEILLEQLKAIGESPSLKIEKEPADGEKTPSSESKEDKFKKKRGRPRKERV